MPRQHLPFPTSQRDLLFDGTLEIIWKKGQENQSLPSPKGNTSKPEREHPKLKCQQSAALTLTMDVWLHPVIAALLQNRCDSVQVAETCFAFIGSDKAEFFLLSLRLDERIEDIMNLSHKARD